MIAPAVFLDKDGTLLADVPYNVDPEQMRLLPGAADGLRMLNQAGYLLVIISNQPGVALGHLTEADLRAVEKCLHALFMDIPAPLAGFYYCPHYPEGKIYYYGRMCACRKPAPGLIFRAAIEHTIDLSHSWFVGDMLDDVEAGRRAGCRTVLIDNGHETDWKMNEFRRPHSFAADFTEAASFIVSASSILRHNESENYSTSGKIIAPAL